MRHANTASIRRWQAPGQENYARTASFCRWTSTTTVRCPDVSSQRCSPASPIASNRFPWMNAIWTSPARCCGGRVARAIGAWIRDQVARRYHITCSVGIAANKLVAKMASTNAKPDGMLMIPVARHAEFVQMMPLRGIPGIGPSLEKRLNAWGVDSVADLAKMSDGDRLATADGVADHQRARVVHGGTRHWMTALSHARAHRRNPIGAETHVRQGHPRHAAGDAIHAPLVLR